MKRKFWFGKYKGRAIVDIIYEDHQYVTWCLANISNFLLNEDEINIYQNEHPARRSVGHLSSMCSELDFSDYDDYTFGMINCSADM